MRTCLHSLARWPRYPTSKGGSASSAGLPRRCASALRHVAWTNSRWQGPTGGEDPVPVCLAGLRVSQPRLFAAPADPPIVRGTHQEQQMAAQTVLPSRYMKGAGLARAIVYGLLLLRGSAIFRPVWDLGKGMVHFRKSFISFRRSSGNLLTFQQGIKFGYHVVRWTSAHLANHSGCLVLAQKLAISGIMHAKCKFETLT